MLIFDIKFNDGSQQTLIDTSIKNALLQINRKIFEVDFYKVSKIDL